MSTDNLGNKIIIDSTKQIIKLVDWLGNTMGYWQYDSPELEVGKNRDVVSNIRVNHRVYHSTDDNTGTVIAWTNIKPGEIHVAKSVGSGKFWHAYLNENGVRTDHS